MVNFDGALDLAQLGTPANPASGRAKLYFKNDDKLYGLNVAGTEVLIGPISVTTGPVLAKVATTANIALSGTQTIDGVSCVTGDRVLVTSQSTPANNGLYVVTAGSWGRAPDQSSALLVGSVGEVQVQSGTVNGGTRWYTSFKITDTLGTTAQSWYSPDVVLTYTPTLGNMTIGNGSVTGRYTILNNKWVNVRIFFQAGSTTSYTGSGATITLPITVSSTNEQNLQIKMYDAATGNYHGLLNVGAGTAVGSIYMPLSATNSTNSPMTTSTLRPGTAGNFSIEGHLERA